MRLTVITLLALLLAFAAVRVLAANLPGGLVPAEIDAVTQSIGFSATSRLLRSAETYPSWPGAKLGMELAVAPSRGIGGLGNGTGSIPSAHLVPRFFIAKGLFTDIELVLSFFPMLGPTGFKSMGGFLKWSYHRESTTWLASAAYFGYTSITAYNGDYEGSNAEFGTVFSKDLVRLKPFAGGGILFAQGTVARTLAATSARSSLQATLHLFLGAELEFPVNVTFQFDLMNLVPMATLSVAKKF